MPVAPSFTDLLAQYEAEALAQLPALVFAEGDLASALQHGSAAQADAVIRFVVQAFKITFIDGAQGADLTALVKDHTGIDRSPATFAQATVTFARTGAGPGGTLPTGFVVASQIDAAGNTATYALDGNVTFGAGDNGPHDGGVTAQVSGRAGNVAAGTITRLIGSPFDSRVTCTNAAVAGGGNDEENDNDLKVRARSFWQTLRRGTLAALEFGARDVTTVRIARATEDAVTGLVTLVVTDSDGNSTAQMVADVTAEIENWRSGGSIVQVFGGTALIVDVTGTLVAEPGVDTSVLGAVAADAIRNRMDKQRQGETLFLDSIKSAAIGVDPDALNALTLTTPNADVVPAAFQVIRPGVVTVS